MRTLTRVPTATTMAPKAKVPRCSKGEIYDRIEQQCVGIMSKDRSGPVMAPSTPATTKTPKPKPDRGTDAGRTWPPKSTLPKPDQESGHTKPQREHSKEINPTHQGRDDAYRGGFKPRADFNMPDIPDLDLDFSEEEDVVVVTPPESPNNTLLLVGAAALAGYLILR